MRSCTCHPQDNPPRPCQQRYAYHDCIAWQPRWAIVLLTPTGWKFFQHYERRWSPAWGRYYSWEYRQGALEWRNPSQWD